MKHLQIIVNGITPRDATNTRRRQKLFEVNQLLRDKCTSYKCLLSKTRYRLDNPRWWAQQNFVLQRQHPSPRKRKKKLAVSIKTKLDNIRINCHEIAINEKVLPTVKAVDYRRTDYRRAITTSSRNRQSNFSIKRNIKLQSPKCQLNFKTSTKFLTNQSQIQTKTQPETTSHPKHIVQTRNNDNISQSIKRKDAKQGKLHKTPIANPTKKKLATKCPFTKKQETNSLLITQIHLHITQTHRDERNKQNTSSTTA